MLTLTRPELAFLAVLGDPELTKSALKLYASGTLLFTEVFCPHLNLMWNAYIKLLTRCRKERLAPPSIDVVAATLSEEVQASGLAKELKDKCDTVLQRLVNRDKIPDQEQGRSLLTTLARLDGNRKLLTSLNSNADFAVLQQTLDASKRSLSLLDESQADESNAGFVFSPFRDIEKLVTHTVKVPTGINWLDETSSGGGRAGELWLILGAPGGGKCLGLDTPVLMFDGTVKPVQDIVAGDRLMGPDSRPRAVLSTTSGRGRMYKVHMKRGDSFTCNYCHILTLVVDSQRGVTIKGKRYLKGDLVDVEVEEYLRLSNNVKHKLKAFRCGVDFQPRAEPELDPYFVGIYLGDGTRRRAEITTADREVIDYCRAYAESIGLAVRVVDTCSKAKAVKLSSPANRAKHNGKSAMEIVRRNTLDEHGEKCIHDSYKLASRANRQRLLAGLVDSDGYAHHGGYDIVFKSRRLAEDTAFLARSLGYAVTLRRSRKVCCNTGAEGEYWRLNIGGSFDSLPIKLERRLSARKNSRVDPRCVGFTLEELPEDCYYGFTLDGDGRFLLGDFTVTHNTVCAVQYVCAQAMLGNDVLWATFEQSMEGDIAERMVANITDTSLDVIRDRGFKNLPPEVQERFWASVAGVDDRLTALDMTRWRQDPSDPSDNCGVMSVWKQLKKLKAEGRNVKTVILDWFGAMMSRVAANAGLDLSACYRFKAQEEINTLIQMAKEEQVLVIVFHQLDAKSAAMRPTHIANGTNAQDMHNMQNFFDLVFTIGIKDANNVCYFSSVKARKGNRITKTLRLIGDKSRFVMEEGWVPNRDGNFYKPGADGQDQRRPTATDYNREID